MDTLPVLVTGHTVRSRHPLRRPLTRVPLLVAAALIAACSGGSADDSSEIAAPPVDVTTDTETPPRDEPSSPATPDEPAPPALTAPPVVDQLAWTSMNGPPGAGLVSELVQTTGAPHTLFALNQHGVYVSADGGEQWQLADHLAMGRIADIVARDDDLLACGEGVHALSGPNTSQLFDGPCDTVAVHDDAIVIGTGAGSLDGVRIRRATASSDTWQDLSPSATDLGDLTLPPRELEFGVQVSALAPVGDDVLAGFTVWTEGSGEHTNGGLFRRDAAAEAWERVPLPTPDTAVVNELLTDPDVPDRVLVLFRHSLLHEWNSPISGLAYESLDGGASWTPLTDAFVESNGVTDVAHVGTATYLLNPWNSFMLRIEGDTWDTVEMPTVAEFPQFTFNLERLLVDPDDPAITYGMAGEVWELGLLKSADGMQTWTKMDTSIVASSPTIVVGDPDDPSVVYTSGNVIQESYATADGGATWQPFTPVTAGDELDIDPHHTEHMLLVDESTHLFESFDGGATFSAIAQDFTSAKVLDVEVADDGAGSVYVSNLGVGITRLGPDGPLHMSNSPDYSYDIEIDPDDPRVVYATNSPKKFEHHGSVWRYDPDQVSDFGWSEILHVENSAGITSLSFDPSDPDTIYAGDTGAEGNVWVSRDRGESWAMLNPDLTFTTVQGHSQIVVNRLDDDSALVGTWGGGSFATTDGGDTWSQLDDAHTFSPTCLVAAPSDPQVVYACDRTAPKVHRSLDAGATWDEYADLGPGHLTTTAIAVDPLDPDLIYVGTFRPPAAMLGSLLAVRNGEVVDDIGAGLPRAVIEIDIDEGDPATLYATTHLHGLFRSDDAGTTWQRLDDRGTGLPRTGYLDIDVDPHDSQRLFATSLCGELPDYVTAPVEQLVSTTEPFRNIDPDAACGVYRSDDRGESWTLVLETIDQANGVDISPTDPDHVYVADAAGGVWVSTDGGATWQQRNDGLATTSVAGVAVGASRIYAATQGSGVCTGTIGAAGQITWDGTHGPRTYVYRVQVEVDPSNPQRIYAAAYPGGVLRSDDGGVTWRAKNFLTPSIRVTDPVLQGYYALDIDPQDPQTVWLGVYGKGVIVSHDGRDFAVDANGTDQLLRGKHITSVAVDPLDSARVLVGSEEGLFTTTDGGRTWSETATGLDTTDIRTLEIATPAYAPFTTEFDDVGDFDLEAGWSVADGMLTGNGHTWAWGGSPSWSDYSFESEVLVSQGGLHINARVSDEGRYFVAFGEGALHLSKQYDGWEQFAELATATANVDRGRRHVVRIDLDGDRIQVSLDGTPRIDVTDPDPILRGGIAFESLDDSTVSIDRATVTPAAEPSQWYAGTGGYGLYRFDQNAERWASLGPTFGGGWWAPWQRRMYQFSSIVFDPAIDGRMYFGHFPSGFFISDDGGHTWRDSSVGLGNDGMFSVTLHPSDPNILFAGTYNGIVASTDGGATWYDSSDGMPPEQWPYTVAIDDDSPNVMYTSTKNGQNQGFCHRNDVCGVVMKSTDGGQTWRKIMTGLDSGNEYYTLLIHPADHDTLFLSSSDGVFISLDAGDSWWPITNGLPTTHNQVRDNVADNLALTADQDTLLLGVVGHGLWRLDLSPLGADADV